MQVDFSNNYFELFELPVRFTLDETVLAGRYKELQRVLHPDRFAAATENERRWSVQAASFVNDGYQTLLKSLPRAVYMLGLAGISIDEETDTAMPADFLMEQMELREALDDATNVEHLDDLEDRLQQGVTERQQSFDQASQRSDWDVARGIVRQWQFLDKLRRDVRSQAAALDDEGT